MGACFSTSPPPAWYVRKVIKLPSGEERAERTGPYTFETLAQMRREGTLAPGDLVSTTEAVHRHKDFPDGPRRVSGRWARIDQLGDEVHRRLDAEERRQGAAAGRDARAAALAGEGPAAPATVGVGA